MKFILVALDDTNEVEFDNFEDNSFFNNYPDFDSLNV